MCVIVVCVCVSKRIGRERAEKPKEEQRAEETRKRTRNDVIRILELLNAKSGYNGLRLCYRFVFKAAQCECAVVVVFFARSFFCYSVIRTEYECV